MPITRSIVQPITGQTASALTGGGGVPHPNIVVNGTFDSGTTGWSASGSTLSAVGGKLVVTATGGTQARARQTLPTVIGRQYNVIFKARKPNGVVPSVGSFAASGMSAYITSATETELSYTFIASATSTVFTLEISGAPSAGVTGEFDDVIVR